MGPQWWNRPFQLNPLGNGQSTWNRGLHNTGHQATKDSDPWKVGNKWREPWGRPNLLPGKRPQAGVWAAGPGGTHGSLNGGDGSRVQRAQDGRRSPTGCPGGEIHPERTPRLTQPLPSSAHLTTSQCRQLETAPSQGRKHKRIQGDRLPSPLSTQCPLLVLAPIALSQKTEPQGSGSQG